MKILDDLERTEREVLYYFSLNDTELQKKYLTFYENDIQEVKNLICNQVLWFLARYYTKIVQKYNE